MNNLEEKLLDLLKTKEVVHSDDLHCNTTKLHSVLLSLQSKGIVEYKIFSSSTYCLTEKGEDIVLNGSPEYNIMMKLKKQEIKDLNEVENKEAISFIYKNKWLEKEEFTDLVKEMLKEKKFADENIKMLKKRKFIELKKANKYEITKGACYGNDLNFINELTIENMNKIKPEQLKPYNFDTEGTSMPTGALHPLSKIKREYKKIFLEMGFVEMATDKYVENSFWNFDALFQPQNHPSREAQDTFFLSEPAMDDLQDIDEKYIEKVKNVHEGNSSNIENLCSLGHKNPWNHADAKKNILRTHTTAVSTKILYKLAQNKTNFDKNFKFFSIDKVFRNETVDATHLAEFHQIEGVVVGKNLGLKELINVIQMFFKKLGIENLRFKAAFNPYTEPSMEIFGYHEGLKKWIELGNSGIFRPEMLLPMGFPEDVTVIAWGLSLERPAMIRYGLNNIRELVGHKVDVNFIRNSTIIFMDK